MNALENQKARKTSDSRKGSLEDLNLVSMSTNVSYSAYRRVNVSPSEVGDRDFESALSVLGEADLVPRNVSVCTQSCVTLTMENAGSCRLCCIDE